MAIDTHQELRLLFEHLTGQKSVETAPLPTKAIEVLERGSGWGYSQFNEVLLLLGYAKWEIASEVATRATRFFRDGRPYTAPLRAAQTKLDEARTLRNAVAHRSETARKNFEALARNQLGGTLPPGVTIGGFLNTPRAASTPPESFLEHYLGSLQLVAEQIVRP